MPPNGEPELDQCIVRGAERDYLNRHPGAADVGLLVEIADTSLVADREMARIYGPRGISVYWIVNLRDSQIEVHTMPTADGYGLLQAFVPGDEIPIVLDGVEVGRIAVNDILP